MPFSMTELSKIEMCLGTFSAVTFSVSNFPKEFKKFTQPCNLTRHNFYVILSSTLILEEKERGLVSYSRPRIAIKNPVQ